MTMQTESSQTEPVQRSYGIPLDATEFYAELELNNNREWWLANKSRYESLIKKPMEAVLEPLDAAFGHAKFFRPYRDQRFSPDKSPYKTAQGVFVSNYEEVGYYLQISADGIMLGGGYRSAAPAQLARFRASIDAPASGAALMKIVADLKAQGFEIDGDKLKTVPRGFDKDHPRGELLKFKTIQASIYPGKPEWLAGEQCGPNIRQTWEQLRPLIDWVVRYAAP